MLIFEFSDYRNYLKFVYSSRQARNISYSLRAFSRDLELSPTRMSDILSQKQGLSNTSAKRVGELLGLNQQEQEYFTALVDFEHSRSKNSRLVAGKNILLAQKKYKTNIDPDQFALVSEWYHFALLELIELPHFKNDFDWMAKQLGITKLQCEEAIHRLLKLKLVSMSEGELKRTEKFTGAYPQLPSTAVKQYHQQIINKSLDAIWNQPLEKRDFSAINMRISEKQLNHIKQKIYNFRMSLIKEIEKENDRNQVYCLSFQLFNLQKETSL